MSVALYAMKTIDFTCLAVHRIVNLCGDQNEEEPDIGNFLLQDFGSSILWGLSSLNATV